MTRPEALSPLPLYHKIYMVLHEQIMEGAFPVDAPMPGELELADRFGVSRITMRRALERLTREGMIDRQRGRGTYPTPRAAPARPLQAGLSGLLENLLAMGLATRVRLLDFGYVQASDEVAARLDLTPGAVVQKAVRVRSHEGAPLLSISRVLRDQNDQPVEYIRALYRPDRYEFQISMFPGGGPDSLWQPAQN